MVWCKKNSFFVKKRAMGASKFPLTIFFRLYFPLVSFLCFFFQKKAIYYCDFVMRKKAKKSQNPTSCTKMDGVFEKIIFFFKTFGFTTVFLSKKILKKRICVRIEGIFLEKIGFPIVFLSKIS